MATPTFRSRILDAKAGYKPRIQVELLLRAGIGSILSKPQWWLKWRGVLPAKRSGDDGTAAQPIAEKWLDEIVSAVLENRFYWMNKHIQSRLLGSASERYRKEMLQRVVGYPVADCSDREEKLRAFRQEQHTTIGFEFAFDQDNWPENASEGVNWDADRWTIIYQELDGCRFFSSNEFIEMFKALDSTSAISWYFTMLAHAQRGRAHENGEWMAEEALNFVDVPFKDEAVHKRAIDLIKAARKGDVTKETFLAQYPDADARPEAVDLLWFHIDRAVEQMESICACVRATLDDLIDRHDLMGSSGAKGFVSPGPVMETWMSDSIVPADLKAKFVSQVAKLEDVPEDQKDWHPGSNNQVLDLVHPSLYCCVLGETAKISEAEAGDADLSPADRMHRMMFLSTKKTDPASGDSGYQWIPSDFKVDNDGNVKIKSYINNLHPVHHQDMYESIERIFSGFVPLFDRVLSWLANDSEPKPLVEDTTERNDVYYTVPTFPEVPSRSDIEPECPTTYSVKGTTLQVITKIAEIHLTPENPTYPGGAWHIEGTETENIVATGIYYFGSKNITESKLSFRVIVQPPESAHGDFAGMATAYGLESDRALVQSLGAAVAVEDRCIVFPNTFQHKVEPFELTDPSKPGVRKILAFFIVDPSKKIHSTPVIPPQQATWLQEAQRDVLRGVHRLPEVVAEDTLSDMLGRGMSLDNAMDHRERLMKQRGPFNFDDHEEELMFSLCEH
ncbi:hypothetical protein PINS_up007879 [Pythium insidiosum]|nr:hypothetical protein PINS_up007879 [Pythium insidiosum]